MRIRATVAVLGLAMMSSCALYAETCTTQSQMTPADRDGLAAMARSLAAKVQANDVAGLKAVTVAEYSKDFAGIGGVVASTAPHLQGGAAVVEQIYILDASQLKAAADGSFPDAQFFCTLNKSQAEADFAIPGLTPGRYGFVMVDVANGSTSYRLSFLLRQGGGQWQMAGFYPMVLEAAGHDGLWYWKQARALKSQNEHWSAWLYYQQAENLLRPTRFIQSTHLEKLQTEATEAAPPALSEGVSGSAPLVVKGPDGAEYHFTALGLDDSMAKDQLDVTAHLKVDQLGDAAAAKKRNTDAMVALLAAYPELRKTFHGVWIFAEAPGQSPFVTEQPMTELH